MDVGTIAGIVGVGVAVNTIDVMRKGDASAVPGVIFAGAAMFTVIAGVGQFVDWNLATILAVLFLLASFLTRGQSAIEWFSALVEGF